MYFNVRFKILCARRLWLIRKTCKVAFSSLSCLDTLQPINFFGIVYTHTFVPKGLRFWSIAFVFCLKLVNNIDVEDSFSIDNQNMSEHRELLYTLLNRSCNDRVHHDYKCSSGL